MFGHVPQSLVVDLLPVYGRHVVALGRMAHDGIDGDLVLGRPADRLKGIPDELIDRLTTNLFPLTAENDPPQHPYETIAGIILNSIAKLKVGSRGIEAEVHQNGLKTIAKKK